MSFNFGNTSTGGLGASSTPAKPSGFGNFSFGGAGSTTAAAAPPVFGAAAPNLNSSFSGTSAFGGANTSFGAQPAATPAFGFGTTSTASTAAPAFGFGTQTTASVAPTFGSGAFGTANTAAQPSALGTSFSGFGGGTATSSAAPAFGGLGQANTSTGFGSFGTGFGGFNSTATTSAAPLFSGFGGTTTAASGFGGFGSSFGQPAASAFGSTFGQQPAAQQQPPPLNPDEAFAQSIFNVSIFGDERDTVIAKWNYLQAMWGTGKSFYNQNAAPVDITPQNYLCRYKTMSYSKIAGKDNKMGFVSIVFGKPVDQIRELQQQLVQQLGQLFGNKPTLTVVVESMKPISESKCQVTFYIEDKSQANETKRILATEVCAFLNQPMTKTQCTNMGIEQIFGLIAPDEDQLKEYLENPPKGIDPRLWKQAKEDNPDSKLFIPVPIVGFNELKWRIKCQESETDTHIQYLAKVQSDLAELKQRHANATAKIMEHRRKFADLSHRILKIIVKQESTRKMGVALTPEEEMLRSKLENMQALVSAPTQFKGRLSELLSQMRMQRNQWNHTNITEYTLDNDSAEEMKTFLTMQQKAMAFLIETVNKDMKSLNIISDGMRQLVRN